MKILDKYWNYYIIIFLIFIFIKPAISILILGLIIFFKGLDYILFIKSITKNGIKTTGEILIFKSDKDGYKLPLIKYKTNEGKIFEEVPYLYIATDLSFFKTYKNRIGQIENIIYDKKYPNKMIQENENKFNYFGIFLMLVIGLLLTTLSVLSLLNFIQVFK